jgi:hypothetical protein
MDIDVMKKKLRLIPRSGSEPEILDVVKGLVEAVGAIAEQMDLLRVQGKKLDWDVERLEHAKNEIRKGIEGIAVDMKAMKRKINLMR